MTVGKLKVLIANVSDDAKVYVVADHGQLPEQTGEQLQFTASNKLPYCGEDISWDENISANKATAILIR